MNKNVLSPKKIMKTVGQILREKRESKGLTLKEIAEAIKVREKYLIAIEKGNYSEFASPVYLKGFIKNYAIFLGMNPEHVLAIYRRDTEEKKKTEVGDTPVSKLSEKAFIITPQLVISFFGIIFIISLVIYLILQFYKIQQPPMLEVTSPKDGETVVEQKVRVEGKTVPDANLTINGEAIRVQPDGKFDVEITLQPGTNMITVVSKDSSNIGKEAVNKLQIFYDDKTGSQGNDSTSTTDGSDTSGQNNSQGSQTIETPTPQDKLTAVVEIGPSDAWLEVYVDDQKVLSKVLKNGEKKEFTALSTIYVITGKISSTKFIVNGKEQKFTSQAGIGRLKCTLGQGVDGFVCEAAN